MRINPTLRIVICTVSLVLTNMPAARADYVSRTYQFDLSDSVPGGESFGSVLIEAYNGVGTAGGGLSAGQVRMTFQANPLAAYGPLDASFGFHQVGFNSTLDLSNAQIAVPTGFKLRNDRFMGGFGKFRWQAYGDPAALAAPLSVTISDLGANALLENFVLGSKSSTGEWPLFGSVYFAGRIGGFELNDDFFDLTSHVAGVSAFDPPPPEDPNSGGGDPTSAPNANPEPSTFVLALCGLGAFLGVRRAKKNSLAIARSGC